MLLTALAGLGVVKTITANPLTFELFTDKAGAYRFRLTGEEQQILLKSQGYTSERGARNGIASVRENAMQDERFVPSTASNGMYYFNLKAGNRQIIGTSSHYAEVASRNAAIADVKRWAAQASLAEQTP
ncbi:MAG: YegP family protein [Pseudomonadota bacterium]